MSTRRRRSNLKGPERRDQILETAKRVFSRRGYRQVNVADICDAAGIGRGTLYIHFENKRAVLVGLIEQLAAQIEAALATKSEPEPPPKGMPIDEVLRTYSLARIRSILDAVFADEDAMRLLVRDARGIDRTVDQLIAKIDVLVLDRMERDLLAGQALGVLRPCDSRIVSRFCLGGLEKVLLLALNRNEPIDLDAISTTVIDLELYGLAQTPPPVRRRGAR